MSDCLVVFVVRNDAPTLSKVMHVITSSPYSHILPLIVIDGSSDESFELVSSKNVHYIVHEQPLGYGGCLVSALGYANDYSIDSVIMMPIYTFKDWQTIIRYILNFSDSDVITGNRLVNNDGTECSDYSNIVHYIQSKTKLKIVDPFSPIKGVKIKHSDLFELTEFSDFGLVQLLIQAQHFNLRIKEFDCEYPLSELENHIGEIVSLPGIKNFIDAELYLYPIHREH